MHCCAAAPLATRRRRACGPRALTQPPTPTLTLTHPNPNPNPNPNPSPNPNPNPNPNQVAAEAEEGARQLSAWRELFHFELRKPEPGWACAGGEAGVVHTQACFTLLTEPDQEPDRDHEHG